MWFERSAEKHCAGKILLAIWKILLYKNNWNYNSYIFSQKFFSPFCPFLESKKKKRKESNCQQVASLVIRFSVFCFIASRDLRQRHAELSWHLSRNFIRFYSCSYYGSMLWKIFSDTVLGHLFGKYISLLTLLWLYLLWLCWELELCFCSIPTIISSFLVLIFVISLVFLKVLLDTAIAFQLSTAFNKSENFIKTPIKCCDVVTCSRRKL